MNVTKLFSKVNSSFTNYLSRFFCCLSIIAMAASCSSLDNRQESLAKLGNAEFNPDVWAISNEYVRGTMIHDFLVKNSPITDKDRSFIIHQLGNSTAYFEYDVNPAYYIGNSPKVGHLKAYLVAFIIDQQTGKVRDIQVYPELE